MKLINSSFEIIPQAEGLEGIHKQVELAARCCYQSFDRQTKDSYKKLLKHLGSNGHMSPFAHGTVYLRLKLLEHHDIAQKYQNNFWSKVKIETGSTHGCLSDSGYYITTNMRVIKENNWEDDLKYWCEPTKFHVKRTTVKINCSIGISRELNRHSTVLAIAESSTRYCNYSKDKFNNEITFIKPYWYDKFNEGVLNSEENRPDGTSDMFTTIDFLDLLSKCEAQYLAAILAGAKPQEAREILPLCTATAVFYTAFDSDWKEVFKKRTTTACHPDMIAIMKPLEEEFKRLNKI